jgi:hypothetical protein
MDEVKILHEWEVIIDKEVEETSTEVRDGQTVTITRKVIKPIPTKMALKQPTRRELRKAELFYGKEFNKFVTMGFLPRSIMVNKHLDISGGIMSDKERAQIADLLAKKVGLEADLVRATNEPQNVKEELRNRLVAINTQLLELNSANESVFSQTAETKAQGQLTSWFAFFFIVIDRNGAWHPYFAGDTFEQKEEFMWSLEEKHDKFYETAVDQISLYVDLFNRGLNTPEQFKAIEGELKKQLDKKKVDEKKATDEGIEAVTGSPLIEKPTGVTVTGTSTPEGAVTTHNVATDIPTIPTG